MYEFNARAPGPPDGLFLERLDTFMDKCLADIRAFSDREYRPFEETRQYVAEWHSKYLFGPLASGTTTRFDSAAKVRTVLTDTSRALESLSEVSGVQSFVLAVDPNNPDDIGFLGGSVVGREFWRGLRGGGDAGAKSFKVYCYRDNEPQSTSSTNQEEGSSRGGPSGLVKFGPAKSIKSDLYENVRKALRTTSGIRNAEMKWTSPERLDAYGVRLVGWPPSIPAQNPSSLKVSQNKQLLECLENGTMRFEKLFPTPGTTEYADNYNVDLEGNPPNELEDSEDFSWAYDADGGDPSPDYLPDPGSSHATDHTPSYVQLPDTRNDHDCANSESGGGEPSRRKRPRQDSRVFENE